VTISPKSRVQAGHSWISRIRQDAVLSVNHTRCADERRPMPFWRSKSSAAQFRQPGAKRQFRYHSLRKSPFQILPLQAERRTLLSRIYQV